MTEMKHWVFWAPDCIHTEFDDTSSHLFFFFFRATLEAYGSSQARSQIGAAAAGLHHSHSNTGSEPQPRPTPQLTAVPDP